MSALRLRTHPPRMRQVPASFVADMMRERLLQAASAATPRVRRRVAARSRSKAASMSFRRCGAGLRAFHEV